MTASASPIIETWDFVPGYNASKPQGFVEKPKPKTQRLGMGKVILPPPKDETFRGAKDVAIPETSSSSSSIKKPARKPYSSVQLNSKAKAMMDEGDQRSAYEANMIKKEKKKIADREGFEAYMVREAKRHAKEALAKAAKGKKSREERDSEGGYVEYDDEDAEGW